MAITRGSFMGDRGGSGGTISAKGMRRISPKDTANLLRSVSAINKNLLAINKALQKQGALATKEQQQEQNKRRVKAENLQRKKTEAAFEAPKKVGEGLRKALEKPAKKIFTGLMKFVKPFVQFFAIGFIGWFAKGVVGWFRGEKEKRKKQIKDAIPKIITFMTVAGGVLLALKFGIPLILTTLTALVTTIPVLIGALLNPVTWTALLAAAAAAILPETADRIKEKLRGGQRAERRLDERFSQSKYFEKLKENSEVKEYRGSEFIKYEGRFYRAEDVANILSGKGGTAIPYNAVESYEQTKGLEAITNPGGFVKSYAMVEDGGDAITASSVASGRFFRDIKQRDRTNLEIYTKAREKLMPTIMRYATANNKLQDARQSYNEAADDSVRENVQGLIDQHTREKNKQLAVFQRKFDKMDLVTQELLGNAGITRNTPLSAAMVMTEPEYAFRKEGGRILDDALSNMNLPTMQDLKVTSDKFRAETAKVIDRIAEFGSEIELNLNINPIADLTEDDSDQEIPTPGGIAPFNLSDPYVQYSKKTYLLLGVI
jgi:hypothetical protein